MGSSIVCERVTTSKPTNAIISWQDGDSIFYLREKIERDISMSELRFQNGIDTCERHLVGTVWAIGTKYFLQGEEGLGVQEWSLRVTLFSS
jgi:hypothetical protein